MKEKNRFILWTFILVSVVMTARLHAEKSLKWELVEVQATLRNDSTMVVEETQAIRFNGDWNGAYRNYETGWGERIEILSVERKQPDGSWKPLQSGSTDTTDSYTFDRNTGEVKWRARNPDDPPFEDQLIEYRIKLKHHGLFHRNSWNGYSLNHDFAFSDREDSIDRIAVTIDTEENWQHKEGQEFPLSFESENSLKPGEGFIVKIPLEYTGDESSLPESPFVILLYRVLTWLIVPVLLLLIQLLFVLLAARKGVFRKPQRLDADDYDRAAELIDGFSPEEIAILAEKDTAAAWLSKLITEGKLRITAGPDGNQYLEKVAADSDFSKQDREILSELFINESRKISSEEIRQYYKNKRQSFSLYSAVRKQYVSRLKNEGYLYKPDLFTRFFRSFFDFIAHRPFLFFLFFAVFMAGGISFAAFVMYDFGISVIRFMASVIVTMLVAVLASGFSDKHYGFFDLEYNRFGAVRYHSIFAVLIAAVLPAFYVWQIPLEKEILGAFYLVGFLIAFRQLYAFRPARFAKQIKASLRLISVKNFLELKLYSDDECDIPPGYASIIVALGLAERLENRIKKDGKTDCLHLLPENIEKLADLKGWNQSGMNSQSARSSSHSFSTTSPAANVANFAGAGGSFGGAGASAGWSGIESFASNADYSTPSSSSSSSGSSSSSSSSGGGGGGGW